MSAAEFFKKNKWVKINKFIDQNMANLLYYHVLLENDRLDFIKNDRPFDWEADLWGTKEDPQAMGDFSKYGEPIFDALLSIGIPQMEEFTGKKLLPTYTYHRLYTNGTELKRHKDRPSCEISTTLCLGYDVSNMNNVEYNWPMWVKNDEGIEYKIHLKPGDMIIYRGCEIEHWREPYEGINHAQVFMHYNDANGPYNIKYDGRPMLGLPGKYKNYKEDIDENYVKIIE